VDWAAAFQSPEVCAGLQSAVTAAASEKSSRARVSRELEVAALAQLGEIRPTVMAAGVSAALPKVSVLTAPS
jgi:hypothetical protein